MKSIFIIGLFALSQCLLTSGSKSELFKKIENHELITKAELEKLIPHKFKGYEEKFIGTGSVLSTGNVHTGIVQGTKSDTIYDILIVCRNNSLITVKENASASFYRKGETIHREFMLGQIYTTYKGDDTTCIKAYFETIQPFKVDTLSYKFRYDMGKVLSKDSLEFCSGNK